MNNDKKYCKGLLKESKTTKKAPPTPCTIKPMNTATLNPATPAPVALGQDARVMGLVGLAHASSHFGHMLLPPMFPIFMRDFGLSFSQVGLLMTVFFVVSGLGQAAAGFLVDKVGARPVLFAALATFALACLAASVATGYAGLAVAAALAGLANASFHPVDFTILNQRVSGARIGHAFSVHGLTGSLGWALAPPFFVLMLWISDWRTAYVVAGALYMLVLAVMVLNRSQLLTHGAARGAPDAAQASKQPSSQPSAVAFLKLPVIWWCFGFFLLSTMTLAMVQSYVTPILQAMHQLSFNQATTTLTAYMLCSALGILVGGFVVARMAQQSDRTVALCMAAGAACMALAATGWLGAVGSMVVLAATGFAIGIGQPSRDMMIKKATPKGATGRVYGMVYSGLDVGFAISPLLFGALMDRGLHMATLLGGAVVLMLSVGAALAVGRRTAAAVSAV
jgi:MFS transporter, FSR family, fosmidomycin resistance protein